jgi:enoyl reductase-like protein
VAKFSAPGKEYGRYFPWQAVCTPDNLPIFAGRQIPETMENRITSLFGIRYPIVAGGMIWCSGWRLAAAVSEAGGLGLIGSGSMTPDLLREHIRKCRAATEKPFGVNVPLM